MWASLEAAGCAGLRSDRRPRVLAGALDAGVLETDQLSFPAFATFRWPLLRQLHACSRAAGAHHVLRPAGVVLIWV